MPALTDNLTITQLTGEGEDGLWRLEQALAVRIGERAIVVPSGFKSDGPSVPQWVQSALPQWGKWSRAGIVHDYLCCLIAWGRAHPGREHPLAKTRHEADVIFLDLMIDAGVGFVQCRLLYLGVCIGTWANIETTMHHSNLKLFEVVSAASEFS